MSLDGIFEAIGTIAKWWTPEKVKSRAREKLKNLEEEAHEILKKEPSAINARKLLNIRRNIKRLQDYLANN